MRFDYGYTSRGEVLSVTRYSDLAGTTVVGTTTHDYDSAGRETHLVQKNGSGTVLAEYTYTYDAADRMSTKVENGTTTSYSYDVTDQLTADGATGYSYDATGNRTNTGYVTGTGNQMTSDGLWTWTYDANGNVTKRSKGASSDTWVYTYDNRNQMVSAAYSATDGGTVTQRVTYVYDAFGNQIERDYWNGTSTTVERKGLDGWDPAQPNPVGNEKFNAMLDLDGTNALTMRRVFGWRFDELIARQTSGGTVLSYLTDNQGSVRQLLDNSGTVVGTIAYSAYGQVTTSSGTRDRYGYTSRDGDDATGLQHNGWRYYDVYSGKWLTVDPKGFAAGDANPYRYVRNSPTLTSDPSGLQPPKTSDSFWKGVAGGLDGVIQLQQKLSTTFLLSDGSIGDNVIITPPTAKGKILFAWPAQWNLINIPKNAKGVPITIEKGAVVQFARLNIDLAWHKKDVTVALKKEEMSRPANFDNPGRYVEAWPILGTEKSPFPQTQVCVADHADPTLDQKGNIVQGADGNAFKIHDNFGVSLLADKAGWTLKGTVGMAGFAFFINNAWGDQWNGQGPLGEKFNGEIVQFGIKKEVGKEDRLGLQRIEGRGAGKLLSNRLPNSTIELAYKNYFKPVRDRHESSAGLYRKILVAVDFSKQPAVSITLKKREIVWPDEIDTFIKAFSSMPASSLLLPVDPLEANIPALVSSVGIGTSVANVITKELK